MTEKISASGIELGTTRSSGPVKSILIKIFLSKVACDVLFRILPVFYAGHVFV